MTTMTYRAGPASSVMFVTCNGPGCESDDYWPLRRPWRVVMVFPRDEVKGEERHYCSSSCLLQGELAQTTARAAR